MHRSESELCAQWSQAVGMEPQQKLMKQLVLSGELSRLRLAMAAALGDKAARTVENCIYLADHYRTRMCGAMIALQPRESVRFAQDCVRRIRPSWISFRPFDPRFDTAFEVVDSWLQGEPVNLGMMEACANSAGDAALSADDRDPDKEDAPPEAVRAAQAAIAVQELAYAAAHTIRIESNDEIISIDDVEVSCSSAARNATRAAVDEKAEMGWQTTRLIDYLLKRVQSNS